jgi:NADH-quinone oxidoreductase subunit N
MQNITQSTTDILSSIPLLKPEWTLSIGFLLVIISDLFIKKSKQIVFAIAMLTLIISGAFLIFQLPSIGESQILFNGMFRLSLAGNYFKILVLFGSILSLIFFAQDQRLNQHPKGINDFYSIFLGGVLGAFLLISAANLLMMFLAIEIISLASYLMVSYSAYQAKQAEAGMKYVLFGAVASAMMLYGISLIYGFTGTINFFGNQMQTGLNEIGKVPASLSIVLILTGIGFKLSFVPFHFWTPDAYQEAPTSVTSFLATVPKIAVFALLYLMLPVFHNTGTKFFNLIVIAIAAASMILGNSIAIFQDNPKRMMAYSSIGHTGFILMLFILPAGSVLNALLFYLLVYTLMNQATFMSISYLEQKFSANTISQYKGLGKKAPFLSAMLVVLMVSLTGLPPTAGFLAKFLVFSALINLAFADVWVATLLIIAAVTTVVSLFYYLKIPLNLYFKESETTHLEDNLSLNKVIYVLIIVISISIIALGLFPSLVTNLVN